MKQSTEQGLKRLTLTLGRLDKYVSLIHDVTLQRQAVTDQFTEK